MSDYFYKGLHPGSSVDLHRLNGPGPDKFMSTNPHGDPSYGARIKRPPLVKWCQVEAFYVKKKKGGKKAQHFRCIFSW